MQNAARIESAVREIESQILVGIGKDTITQILRKYFRSETVEDWFLLAPPGIRSWMCTPDFLKFVAEQQHKSFEMAEKFDGAMSEGCKELFREQGEAIGGLRISIVVHRDKCDVAAPSELESLRQQVANVERLTELACTVQVESVIDRPNFAVVDVDGLVVARGNTIAEAAANGIAAVAGPLCTECGGSGSVDSGGFSPQGQPIEVPCPFCSEK